MLVQTPGIFKCTHPLFPILSSPLHNCNLFRGKVVEFINHLVNQAFKGRCVGVGVFLFGGEVLVNEVMKGCWFMF
jgi:hypothetical protein